MYTKMFFKRRNVRVLFCIIFHVAACPNYVYCTGDLTIFHKLTVLSSKVVCIKAHAETGPFQIMFDSSSLPCRLRSIYS